MSTIPPPCSGCSGRPVRRATIGTRGRDHPEHRVDDDRGPQPIER